MALEYELLRVIRLTMDAPYTGVWSIQNVSERIAFYEKSTNYSVELREPGRRLDRMAVHECPWQHSRRVDECNN